MDELHEENHNSSIHEPDELADCGSNVSYKPSAESEESHSSTEFEPGCLVNQIFILNSETKKDFFKKLSLINLSSTAIEDEGSVMGLPLSETPIICSETPIVSTTLTVPDTPIVITLGRERRRIAAPNMWKRNVARNLRQSGKVYVSRNKKTVPEKKPHKVDCEKCRLDYC